jgi:hypothetical protein
MTPPDDMLPDGKLPDGKLPDGKLPDGKLPDGKLPDGRLPDGRLPDSELDARLRADGARWRAAQPAPPGPDLDRLAQAGGRWSSRRWQPLAAAAAVVLLAGGVVGVAATLTRPADRGPDVRPAAAAPPRPSLRELLVRDGDLVGGYGQVVAVPGRPVRFCAPVPTLGVGTVGDKPPAYCAEGVSLVGLDLGRLMQRRVQQGVVSGESWVEGRLRAGTLTVTRQGGPGPRQTAPDVSFPEQPPCPAPAGGWERRELDNAALNRLNGYLTAHPDRYSEIVITYPDGVPSGPTDSPGYSNQTQVALVGTVGDPAAAQRELRGVFGGNLCVARVPHNRTEVDAARARVDPLMDNRSLHINEVGSDYYGGYVTVGLVVLDQRTYDKLVAADHGTGIVAAQPWLRPLHR